MVSTRSRTRHSSRSTYSTVVPSPRCSGAMIAGSANHAHRPPQRTDHAMGVEPLRRRLGALAPPAPRPSARDSPPACATTQVAGTPRPPPTRPPRPGTRRRTHSPAAPATPAARRSRRHLRRRAQVRALYRPALPATRSARTAAAGSSPHQPPRAAAAAPSPAHCSPSTYRPVCAGPPTDCVVRAGPPDGWRAGRAHGCATEKLLIGPGAASSDEPLLGRCGRPRASVKGRPRGDGEGRAGARRRRRSSSCLDEGPPARGRRVVERPVDRRHPVGASMKGRPRGDGEQRQALPLGQDCADASMKGRPRGDGEPAAVVGSAR